MLSVATSQAVPCGRSRSPKHLCGAGVECLPTVHEGLRLSLARHKPGVLVHTYNPSTCAVGVLADFFVLLAGGRRAPALELSRIRG